jgi:hypothetical protein
MCHFCGDTNSRQAAAPIAQSNEHEGARFSLTRPFERRHPLVPVNTAISIRDCERLMRQRRQPLVPTPRSVAP